MPLVIDLALYIVHPNFHRPIKQLLINLIWVSLDYMHEPIRKVGSIVFTNIIDWNSKIQKSNS